MNNGKHQHQQKAREKRPTKYLHSQRLKISFRNPATDKNQEFDKLKKFSSFLYNDSPVVKEYNASGSCSSEADRTEVKVDKII